MDSLDFAPLLWLHPHEDCFPFDPAEFVRQSRLRHHRAWGGDDGWSKTENRWVRSDARTPEFYDIPLSTVNSFGPHADGRNRRPRDENAGHDTDVFLQPDGEPLGSPGFNGRVPVFHWYDAARSQLQFWFFYGYNRGFNEAGLRINHQGDWEHVRVHLEGGAVTGLTLSAHGRRARHPAAEFRRVDGRFVVYVAKHTHAMYPVPGAYPHPALAIDQTADGGPAWETWHRCEPLDAQPWRDFAGAWGEVGQIPATTGPLGPWHKLQ